MVEPVVSEVVRPAGGAGPACGWEAICVKLCRAAAAGGGLAVLGIAGDLPVALRRNRRACASVAWR